MARWLLGLFIISLVAGCDDHAEEVPPVPPDQEVSVGGGERCKAIGGARVLLSEMSLKMEFCRIDSALIEAQTLARALDKEATRATTALLENNRSCFGAGGEIIEFLRGTDRKVPVCRFDDGSMLAEETLAEGPRSEGNLKLVSVLQ